MNSDHTPRKERRYVLCNECAAVGQKKYDIYLTGWDATVRGVCDRCKKEAFVAEYRLQEQGEQQLFSLGAYVAGEGDNRNMQRRTRTWKIWKRKASWK